MWSACTIVFLFTSLFSTSTESVIAPPYRVTFLQQILDLQRSLPKLVDQVATIGDDRSGQVVKRQHGQDNKKNKNNNNIGLDVTLIQEICGDLNKTHWILGRVMEMIRVDFQNEQHINMLQQLPPIKELQLPEIYSPGSSYILTLTYTYLSRVLVFAETMQAQIRSVERSTGLHEHVLNALVQIRTGLGVGVGYRGILHIIRTIYFHTSGMITGDATVTAELSTVPLFLRSVTTRAEALDNTYYVMYNMETLLKGLIKRLKTLN